MLQRVLEMDTTLPSLHMDRQDQVSYRLDSVQILVIYVDIPYIRTSDSMASSSKVVPTYCAAQGKHLQ